MRCGANELVAEAGPALPGTSINRRPTLPQQNHSRRERRGNHAAHEKGVASSHGDVDQDSPWLDGRQGHCVLGERVVSGGAGTLEPGLVSGILGR